ncbi:MAG: hypothetical protein U1F55_05605 [Chitinivorax sp.]
MLTFAAPPGLGLRLDPEEEYEGADLSVHKITAFAETQIELVTVEVLPLKPGLSLLALKGQKLAPPEAATTFPASVGRNAHLLLARCRMYARTIIAIETRCRDNAENCSHRKVPRLCP